MSLNPSLFIGVLIGLAYGVAALISLAQAKDRPVTQALQTIVIGMLIRLFVVVIAVILVVRKDFVEALPFVLALMLTVVVFLFIEVLWMHRRKAVAS